MYVPFFPFVSRLFEGRRPRRRNLAWALPRLRPQAQPSAPEWDKVERYCHYKSVYAKAQADVAKNGAFLEAKNGIAYKNPALAVMNQPTSRCSSSRWIICSYEKSIGAIGSAPPRLRRPFAP